MHDRIHIHQFELCVATVSAARRRARTRRCHRNDNAMEWSRNIAEIHCCNVSRGVYIIHANKKLFFFARATNSFGGMRAGDRASTYTISIPFTLARSHTLRPRFARFACPFYGLSLSFDVSYGTVCAHSSALSKGVGCLCTGNNASN